MQAAHFLPNSTPLLPGAPPATALPTPMPPDWLVPEWPAPPGVRALCTSRNGGVSQAPYNSMNLGLHVGDDASHVQYNRRLLQETVGVRPVFLHQTHGTDVLALQADTPDGLNADAAYTDQAGLACMVMVADCLPVLLCDSRGQQVAAVHAGWRGLLGQGGQGVLERAVFAMRGDQAGAPLLAWLGPCIGPQSFEVGDEVRQAFVQDNAQAQACFAPLGGGKWLVDLPALARQRLEALGQVAVYGNDGSDAWCTVRQPLRYFSHRRDRISGRMAACIWLEGGIGLQGVPGV